MNNLKFKNFFAPLIPTIKKIGFAGQCISGITAFICVCMIVSSKMSGYHVIIQLLGALSIGTAAIFIIEGGLRKLLPFAIRQVMQWNFSNRFWVGMFIVILPLCTALMAASGVLSWNASPELVDIASDEPEQHDITALSSGFKDEHKSIMAEFKEQERAINNAAKDEIKVIRSKYNGQVIQKRKQAKELIASGKPGNNWIVNSVIPSLLSKKADKIAAINANKREQIAGLNKARQEAISSIQGNKTTALSAATSENAYKAVKQRKSNAKWGLFLAGLTLLGLIVFVASVIIEEMYTEGSRDKRKYAPAPALEVIPVASTDNRPRMIPTEKSDNVINNTSKVDISDVIKVKCAGFKKKDGSELLSKRELSQRLRTCERNLENAKGDKARVNNIRKIELLKIAIKNINLIESQK